MYLWARTESSDDEWEKWVRIRFLHTMIRMGILRSGKWTRTEATPISQVMPYLSKKGISRKRLIQPKLELQRSQTRGRLRNRRCLEILLLPLKLLCSINHHHRSTESPTLALHLCATHASIITYQTSRADTALTVGGLVI